MGAIRKSIHACSLLPASILLAGCGDTASDPPLSTAQATPSAIASAGGFCGLPAGAGARLEGTDFCDDFSDGVAARWDSQGGIWQVVDEEYVGSGVVDACATGFATNTSLVRDLRVADVELRVDMRSEQRVDKGIVLRSTGPGDEIELNFRADPYNDLVVQELAACQFVLLEFAARIPHRIGQTIDVHVKLVGDRLVVWIDDELVLDRNFPFRAISGSMGLSVIDAGVSAFDNVQVIKNATCD